MGVTTAQIVPLHCTSTAAGTTAPIEAGIYSITAGVIEAPASPRHRIGLHIGWPASSVFHCGYDRPVRRRLRRVGDIALLPAGSKAILERESPSILLMVELPPALVQEAALDMGFDRHSLTFEPEPQLRDAQIEHIGWALKVELEAGQPNGRPYLEGLGLALSARLVSRYAIRKPGPAPRLTLPAARMRRVTDYIEANLDGDLSLRLLAQIAGLGPSHFKTLFRHTAGLPLHQYVIRRRVERARLLLAQGDLPISQVAFAAGFTHQSHMARHVRRLLGVAPSDLLSRNK
jgi:AraC family transcriptional regulator